MTILSDFPATSAPQTAKMGDNKGNSEDTIPKIVKVRNQDGFVVQFQIMRKNRFRKLMQVYCDRVGLSMHSVHFRFAGQRISKMDTMASMGMQNSDTIEVYQR